MRSPTCKLERASKSLTACALLSMSGVACALDSSGLNSKSADAQDCWEIHSLGTLGGSFSYARDLNNSGQVIGEAQTEPRIIDSADPPAPQMRPFVSAPNGGSLTEIRTSGKFWGDARAINNAGYVVGRSTIGSSSPASYVVEPGSNFGIDTREFYDVNDINNTGQSVFDTDYGNFRSVIASYLGTDATEILLPGWPEDQNGPELNAVALNDYGQVAVNSLSLGYRWSVGEGAINLTPDATSSRVEDINNAAQVVGTLVRDGAQQAFITRRYSTALIMLGTPGDGNEPAGLNNFGQIVGTKNFNGVKHGYVTALWNVQHAINLDTLKEVTRDDWSRLEPAAINDRGQIAGTGLANGEERAFLLTPLWTDSVPHFLRCLRETVRQP